MTLYEIIRLEPRRAPAIAALTQDPDLVIRVLVAFARQAQPGIRYQARRLG